MTFNMPCHREKGPLVFVKRPTPNNAENLSVSFLCLNLNLFK